MSKIIILYIVLALTLLSNGFALSTPVIVSPTSEPEHLASASDVQESTNPESHDADKSGETMSENTLSNHELLNFPKDHGKHSDTNFEWWNFFGHLVDSNNQLYGFALTFLRISAPPQRPPSLWVTEAIYASYFTITDVQNNQFYYQEKINRTSFDFAGASDNHLLVWNRSWRVEMDTDKMTLHTLTKKAGLSLNLTPIKPLQLHGQAGFFQIDPSTNAPSYYYSFPRLQGNGELMIDGKNHIIVAASASMDHEFQTIKNLNMTWDRFVLQLQNNEQMIIYILTSNTGNLIQPASFCVISLANGQSITLKLADFQLSQLGTWRSPDSNITYPSGWLLTIPQYHYRLQITPSVENQEITTLSSTYWQGQATVSGEKDGVHLVGNAYVELSKQANRGYTFSSQ